MLFCATEHGINQDNPTDAMDLTALQEERLLHMKITDTNSFEMRFVVHTANVQDGRNFLFAGRPHGMRSVRADHTRPAGHHG